MDTLIIFVITTLGLCSAQNPPRLSPQKAEVLEDADVRLTCSGDRMFRVDEWAWKGSNNQNFIILSHPRGERFENEFQQNGTLYSVDCYPGLTSILLRNVTRSRHGERWECLQNGEMSNSATIFVIVPVSIVQIVPNDKPFSTMVNTNIQMSCSTSFARPAPNITWFLTNERSDTGKDAPFMNNNDVQITNNTEGLFSSTSIILFNVNQSFDGRSIYCSAGNYPGSAVVSSKTMFDIKYIAQVTEFYVKGYHGDGEDTIRVGENDTLEFICLFDTVASAKIKFQWRSVLFEVSNTTNVTYTIGKVSCMDAGYYTCVGRNEYNYGRPSIRHITLIVNCKPQMHPDLLMEDSLSAELGGTITFRLDILAYPEPSPSDFIWKKLTNENTTLLTNSFHREISIKDLQTSLKIRNVANEDYGKYQLTVTNELGAYTHTFNLEHAQGKNEANNNITGTVVGSVAGFVVLVVIIGVIIFLSRKIYLGRGLPFISNKNEDRGGNNLSPVAGTVQEGSISETTHTYDQINRDRELEREYQQIQLGDYDNKCVYKNIQFSSSATS